MGTNFSGIHFLAGHGPCLEQLEDTDLYECSSRGTFSLHCPITENLGIQGRAILSYMTVILLQQRFQDPTTQTRVGEEIIQIKVRE